MENKKNKAFTLVELIVVVTILAILGTIWFVSYNGYLSWVRDTNRTSQLTSLHDGLELYKIKKDLPMPDNWIEIKNGTELLWYQWYVGTWVLNQIEFLKWWKDPKDGTYFTYYLDNTKRQFQLLTYLEEEENISYLLWRVIEKAEANVDYIYRYPVVYGKKLWILLDNITNAPIQETLTWTLNIATSTGTYKAYCNNTTIFTSSWSNLVTEIMWCRNTSLTTTTPTNPNRYPWCDTDDITVWSYTISACNVWATTASTDWTVSRWSYFQWWRNKWFAYNDSTQQSTQIAWSIWLNASTDTTNFVWSSGLTNWDWSNTDITNNWWHTTNTSVARQWPCAPWYHVPSQAEWQGIVTAWWWWSNGASMQSALKLPYAGGRNWNNGPWNFGGSYGYYWSSTPNGANGYNLYFNSSNIDPSDISNRAYGFSVRCFKN